MDDGSDEKASRMVHSASQDARLPHIAIVHMSLLGLFQSIHQPGRRLQPPEKHTYPRSRGVGVADVADSQTRLERAHTLKGEIAAGIPH